MLQFCVIITCQKLCTKIWAHSTLYYWYRDMACLLKYRTKISSKFNWQNYAMNFVECKSAIWFQHQVFPLHLVYVQYSLATMIIQTHILLHFYYFAKNGVWGFFPLTTRFSISELLCTYFEEKFLICSNNVIWSLNWWSARLWSRKVLVVFETHSSVNK